MTEVHTLSLIQLICPKFILNDCAVLSPTESKIFKNESSDNNGCTVEATSHGNNVHFQFKYPKITISNWQTSQQGNESNDTPQVSSAMHVDLSMLWKTLKSENALLVDESTSGVTAPINAHKVLTGDKENGTTELYTAARNNKNEVQSLSDEANTNTKDLENGASLISNCIFAAGNHIHKLHDHNAILKTESLAIELSKDDHNIVLKDPKFSGESAVKKAESLDEEGSDNDGDFGCSAFRTQALEGNAVQSHTLKSATKKRREQPKKAPIKVVIKKVHNPKHDQTKKVPKVDREDDEHPTFRRKIVPEPMIPNLLSFTPTIKRPKYPKDTELSCKLCNTGLMKIDQLRKHVHKYHRLQFEYTEYIFELGGSVIIKNHDKKCTHVCKLCNFKTDLEVALFRHVRNKHGSCGQYLIETRELARKFICDVCNKSFLSRTTCTKHQRKEHPNFVQEEEQHICSICDKQMMNPQSLKNHIKSQHEDGERLMCHLCPLTFKSKYNLTFHIRNSHGSDFSYRTCPTCNTKLSSEYALKKHIQQVHNKERRHVCDQCGKGFSTKGSLIHHVDIIHENINLKQHQCSVCSKKFNGIRNLQRHVKFVHLQVFPWYCHICTPSKGYRQGYQFRNHLKSQHHVMVKTYDADPLIRSLTAEDLTKVQSGIVTNIGSRVSGSDKGSPEAFCDMQKPDQNVLVTMKPNDVLVQSTEIIVPYIEGSEGGTVNCDTLSTSTYSTTPLSDLTCVSGPPLDLSSHPDTTGHDQEIRLERVSSNLQVNLNQRSLVQDMQVQLFSVPFTHQQ